VGERPMRLIVNTTYSVELPIISRAVAGSSPVVLVDP